MGTTGPSSIDPETGRPYGLKFPVITIADMVRAQAMLVEALGIETLFAVVGGSMGGMQVLQWAADYPQRLFSAICIASAPRHSAQNIAFHEVGRQAIMADPDWRGGAYAEQGARPEKGLSVARMAAHITYLSEAALQRKFGRELQRDGLSWGFDADFQVESYLRYQGTCFVDRFDANSYLYITRAMDYFDLAAAHGGVLAEGFRKAREVRFCVFSFTSDWLYPTPESRQIVRALNAAGARVSFVEIETDKGHDAFFLDEPVMHGALSGFVDAAAQARGSLTWTVHREDFREILRLVRPGSRVLEIGCGEGALLELLAREKNIDGRGLEISPQGVSACLARGLAVVQGDADRDLADYPAGAFDYAILSQTLQQVRDPRQVLAELLRIADRAIVSLPNFGHWRVRWALVTGGRMPVTPELPEPWWSTPNIHLCTLGDFTDLCSELGVRIEASAALTRGRPARPIDPARMIENWRAEAALFLLCLPKAGRAPRPVRLSRPARRSVRTLEAEEGSARTGTAPRPGRRRSDSCRVIFAAGVGAEVGEGAARANAQPGEQAALVLEVGRQGEGLAAGEAGGGRDRTAGHDVAPADHQFGPPPDRVAEGRAQHQIGLGRCLAGWCARRWPGRRRSPPCSVWRLHRGRNSRPRLRGGNRTGPR